MYNNLRAQESTVKFTINLFIALCSAAIFTTCAYVAGKLFVGDFNYAILQDIGLFFTVMITLLLASGTAFFLYTYILELRVAISTYRFYKTLVGHGSLLLLTESYYTVIKTFNTPIIAKHIDGNGNAVTGQWNGVGDWQVVNRKTTKKFSGNDNWKTENE